MLLNLKRKSQLRRKRRMLKKMEMRNLLRKIHLKSQRRKNHLISLQRNLLRSPQRRVLKNKELKMKILMILRRKKKMIRTILKRFLLKNLQMKMKRRQLLKHNFHNSPNTYLIFS